jgi:hypothetical protein
MFQQQNTGQINCNTGTANIENMIVKKKIQKIEATTVFSLESFFLPMAHTD